MGKKNVANLFKGNSSMPHSHGGALTHATHGAANFHKTGVNAFQSAGARNGTGFAAAAADHGSSIAGAGGKFKSPKMRTDVNSILGYATKFGEAMEGIEKAFSLAKYGIEMVSSSFPTEDLNFLASQLEAALDDAERGAMETCQQVPETRYFCAGTLAQLAATSKESRDYLMRYRQRWAVDRTLERKKIAEEMGVLFQRIREDALAYWKQARQVATTRHERGAGEMQMVPAGYDQGWAGPAAAGGRGAYPGVPKNQMSMMNSMVAASSNAQRYGQPFGFSDAAMAAVGSAGRGGLSGVPMGGGGAMTGPTAIGGAGPYGTGSAAPQGAMTGSTAIVGAGPYGTGSAATQGAMFPYQGPSQVPLGAAAAAAAAAFAASTKKSPHQGYATTDSYQPPPRFPTITGPSAAPAVAAGPTSASAVAAGPTSGVQWDNEGRLLYFHPAYQRWFYCQMGSDQGRPFYFNPLTEEKHFGYFQQSSGW